MRYKDIKNLIKVEIQRKSGEGLENVECLCLYL